MDNQSQKKHNGEHPYTDKTGGWMIVLAFVVFLALLTYLFSDLLESQINPNQQVNTLHSDGYREVRLLRNKYGHYVTNGKINGKPVVFLLDTGATTVALSEELAKQLGLKKGRSLRVSTANGFTTAHSTTLEQVSIGQITLDNEPASIINNASNDQVLLGMAFLKHMELIQKGEQLIIRQ